MTTTAHEDQFTPAPVEVTQADRMLVEAIINDYHTTRLDSDYVSHILSKPRTQAAFARHRTASAPAGEVEPVAMQRTIDRLHRELSDLRTKYVDALAAHPPAPADLVEAVKLMMMLERSIKIDVGSCHSNRGPGASSEMREDDRDMRRDIEAAFDRLRTALKHGGA